MVGLGKWARSASIPCMSFASQSPPGTTNGNRDPTTVVRNFGLITNTFLPQCALLAVNIGDAIVKWALGLERTREIPPPLPSDNGEVLAVQVVYDELVSVSVTPTSISAEIAPPPSLFPTTPHKVKEELSTTTTLPLTPPNDRAIPPPHPLTREMFANEHRRISTLTPSVAETPQNECVEDGEV